MALAILSMLVLVFLGIQYAFDKNVTLELSRNAFLMLSLIPIAIFISTKLCHFAVHRNLHISNKPSWISIIFLKKTFGDIILAAAFSVFGYCYVALIIPYVGGEVSYQGAIVRSIETSKERYRRRPNFVRCIQYINLIVNDYEDKSLCFLFDEGGRPLSSLALEPGQKVVLMVRKNVLGQYVESVFPEN
jgi:hypothetical protein